MDGCYSRGSLPARYNSASAATGGGPCLGLNSRRAVGRLAGVAGGAGQPAHRAGKSICPARGLGQEWPCVLCLCLYRGDKTRQPEIQNQSEQGAYSTQAATGSFGYRLIKTYPNYETASSRAGEQPRCLAGRVWLAGLSCGAGCERPRPCCACLCHCLRLSLPAAALGARARVGPCCSPALKQPTAGRANSLAARRAGRAGLSCGACGEGAGGEGGCGEAAAAALTCVTAQGWRAPQTAAHVSPWHARVGPAPKQTAEWRANSFAASQTGRAGRWQRLPKSPPKASALHWPQPLARAAASTQPATGRANSLAAGRTARPERRRRRRGGPGGGREVWRGGNGGVSPSKASAQLLSACCSPWRESARLRAKQPAAGRRGARRENSLPACRAALRSAAQGPF